MRGIHSIIGVLTVLSAVTCLGNECVAPPPPKISGALCGRLIDASGVPVPNVGLRVLGDSDRTMAEVQADHKGDFLFAGLVRGKYRLTATSGGWLIEFGEFEIKTSQAQCTHPVTVQLDFACCCFGSGISKRRPPHY